MPTTLSWESLLLLIRRKLYALLRHGAIDELAIAYENLAIHFEVDEQYHNIPVCHCWCKVDSYGLNGLLVHEKMSAMGLMVIEDDTGISDDYLDGMCDLMIRWDDCVENIKCIRWKVKHINGVMQLMRVDFGSDVDTKA